MLKETSTSLYHHLNFLKYLQNFNFNFRPEVTKNQPEFSISKEFKYSFSFSPSVLMSMFLLLLKFKKLKPFHVYVRNNVLSKTVSQDRNFLA